MPSSQNTETDDAEREQEHGSRLRRSEYEHMRIGIVQCPVIENHSIIPGAGNCQVEFTDLGLLELARGIDALSCRKPKEKTVIMDNRDG